MNEQPHNYKYWAPKICAVTYFKYHNGINLEELLTYLFTYLLTPWGRVLLEKLTGSQLFKKYSTFYVTRRFITAFTTARHLYLSSSRSIQSMVLHLTSWRSTLIFSSHLRLGLASGFFPSSFPTKTVYTKLLAPHTCYMPLPSHSSRFDNPNTIWWGVRITQLLIFSTPLLLCPS